MRTPLDPASRPASRINPSEMSSIALAPDAAASGPAGNGGRGQWKASIKRCSAGLNAANGIPLSSSAQPAAAQPSRPAIASWSPGSAPERSTGARRAKSPSTVTVTEISRPPERSPPTTPQPEAPSAEMAWLRPSARPSAQATGVAPGRVRLTTMPVATAPIALMSLKFCAAAFQPTSKPPELQPLFQSSRKSWSWTNVSVEMTTRPSGAVSTAASSPGPISADAEARSRGKIRASNWPSLSWSTLSWSSVGWSDLDGSAAVCSSVGLAGFCSSTPLR